MGFLGNFGRFVIPDFGVEGGYEHQRIVDVFFDVGFDGFDAHGAFVVEGNAAFANEAGAVEEVINHHGFEHVEFEVSHAATYVDSHVVAHHLRSNHGEGFALGGVYFTGHDGTAGFVVGNKNFANATAWTGAEHTNVVRDFH